MDAKPSEKQNPLTGELQTYDVCIVGGFGHVGLPLGLSLAECGKRVVLFDINERVGRVILDGRMPFLEYGAAEVLPQVLNKTLFVSTDPSVVAASQYVVVTIGTPVDEHLNAKVSVLWRCLDGLIPHLRDDQHIVLRSTLFPGTTEKTRNYLREKGVNPQISFCPERIAQGYAMKELRTLPQIISGFDEASSTAAASLFRVLTNDILFTTPLEAELGKLFINSWRYLEFAIANQFYEIATERGADFYHIYRAITYKYPRAQHFPGAGFAAGPCLFKDTMQLAAYSNNSFFLGHAGMLINEGLPNFLLQQLSKDTKLSETRVGLLGMAFKPNSDDTRDSLAYKVRKLLELEAREVLCSDVYVDDPTFVTTDELIRRCDVIIVCSPHIEYADLVFPARTKVVDVWNFFGNKTSEPEVAALEAAAL